MSTKKLVFDIETVGADFDSLDKTTQEVLTKWIKKESSDEEDYKEALRELKEGLGFSPLTGEIVAIGVFDVEKNQGAVYFQAPGENIEEFTENGIKFKQMTEEEMLKNFWTGALQYDEFITFNGRGFDAPFMMIRSAVHGIKPTKNLMEGRYLYQQRDCKHIDLLDQLTFYGAVRRKGNLHLWSKTFDIKSPKDEGVTGDDVGRLFKEKKFLEIAKYNVGDLRATKELYERWNKFINL
ncbi:MAG: ribonuclease H-like domain-containing protein [Patescibacteria group bacterium]